ncbi:MAG: DUF1624 domain-containing protein [Chloroflexi bacterium]|nr:DUF1624 domain-containing protein [Chloroflexota bacterium]
MTKPTRLAPLDALRGILIILMALDHANSFIAHGKLEPEMWSDLFPNYANQPPIIFLTRLVTHLAAPGFFFLMGAGMILLAASRHRQGWSEGQIVRHLLLRGGLLILLQFLLENLAWSLGGVLGGTIYFGVLYALGGAMMIGTLFLRLPQRWLIGLCTTLIVAIQLLLPETRTSFVVYPLPLRLWLLPGFSDNVSVLYPLMPWVGVTGLGMAYGRCLQKDHVQAYKLAFWLGLSAVILFVLLRWWGGFGNIRPPASEDWVAFLNLVKYPPSVTFLLLTLGVNGLLLALLAQLPEGWLRPFTLFGRVPLFFYLTHLFLYGLMGRFVQTDIPGMYPYWLLGLLILGPLCWAYGRFKDGRSPKSMWRYL